MKFMTASYSSQSYFYFVFYSLLRVEPAQRLTVTDLLEHQWLNEGTLSDVPLDSPSIIVADEVCRLYRV